MHYKIIITQHFSKFVIIPKYTFTTLEIELVTLLSHDYNFDLIASRARISLHNTRRIIDELREKAGIDAVKRLGKQRLLGFAIHNGINIKPKLLREHCKILLVHLALGKSLSEFQSNNQTRSAKRKVTTIDVFRELEKTLHIIKPHNIRSNSQQHVRLVLIEAYRQGYLNQIEMSEHNQPPDNSQQSTSPTNQEFRSMSALHKYITSKRGSLRQHEEVSQDIEAKARVTEVSPRGVVFMNFHFAESPTNLLTNSALDPVSKIPEYKVCAVRIERNGSSR